MAGIDLKVEAMRARVPLYMVAAQARIHPVRLSRLLNEREALTEQDATRIREAIGALAEVRHAGTR
jgi:hypothetical protein